MPDSSIPGANSLAWDHVSSATSRPQCCWNCEVWLTSCSLSWKKWALTNTPFSLECHHPKIIGSSYNSLHLWFLDSSALIYRTDGKRPDGNIIGSLGKQTKVWFRKQLAQTTILISLQELKLLLDSKKENKNKYYFFR